jgi:hypothetical protein
MEIIRKLWWGLYPLPRTFWGFYVFGFFGAWLVVGIPAALLAALFPDFRIYFLLLGGALLWTYWTIVSVAVWRSSNDTRHYVAFWRYAARAVILLYGFMFAKSIVDHFAAR